MKLKLFFLIISAILVFMSFSNFQKKSEGSIGDVKYSVLDPVKFIEENGDGWVLMDDRIPLQGSVLYNKHGITSIPDARGLFIRSLNLNRNDDKADPFTKENNIQRKMGDFQNDQIKSHNHDISGRYLEGQSGSGFNGYGFESNSRPGQKNFSTSSPGGEETRPRNIALYTYIKINE